MNRNTKISYTMHRALRNSSTGGEVSGVDNGVLTAMLKRGLVRQSDGGKYFITDAGRNTLRTAKIDPKSCPSSVTSIDFENYRMQWN